MFVRFGFALLAVSCLTAAFDLDCEALDRLQEDRSQITGKWIFAAGTTDHKEDLEALKSINSSWIDLTPIPDSEDMTLRWGDRHTNGNCVHGSVNTTSLGNTTKVTFHFGNVTYEHTGRHLLSCSGCRVWIDTSPREGKDGEHRTARNLYIFTKSGTLDAQQLEFFKKQAECHDFGQEMYFLDNSVLCPDPADAKEEEQ
ncbi:uncharacterized protein V6R79_013008 [Siganus canaliculatus]